MRIHHTLLVAAIALLAVLSVEVDAESRTLRSLKTIKGEDAAGEERAGIPAIPAFTHTFNFNALDEIGFLIKNLPEQFQRMRTQPERLRTVLGGWYDDLQSVKQVVAFMTKEGLSEKAIEEFVAAYKAYIAYAQAHGIKPAALTLHT
ncbi:hypothetical protein F443_16345 [Phytophthora nicotianae P1569]|uniref:RxLR effector protein n=1 Tax=Phytophthora nicotianae P1569 TaxID=1317065 RepID=V9EI84_PHYNI|nr:hypothetical protein F443_16345 [Phytophthora nicotianae P1569]